MWQNLKTSAERISIVAFFATLQLLPLASIFLRLRGGRFYSRSPSKTVWYVLPYLTTNNNVKNHFRVARKPLRILFNNNYIVSRENNLVLRIAKLEIVSFLYIWIHTY